MRLACWADKRPPGRGERPLRASEPYGVRPGTVRSRATSIYARFVIRLIHRITRAIGVVVLIGGLVAAIYLYQSPSHDFKCDTLKRIEREMAGKDYWCWWPD